MQEGLEGVRNNLFNNLLGGFLNIPQAIGAGIAGIVEAITGGSGGLGSLASWSSQIQDNVSVLQTLTQYLPGIACYGAVYMPVSRTAGSGFVRAPFSAPMHDGVGVAYEDDGITLLSGGLFHLTYHVTFAAAGSFGDNNMSARIEVHRPDGSLYREVVSFVTASSALTATISDSLPVVVPGPGFRVNVGVSSGGGSSRREAWPGLNYSSLSVNKWSDEDVEEGE